MTASSPSRELATAVEAAVLSLAADIAGRTFDASAAERPLHALGFDSLQYVELSGCLNDYYGLDLAPTLFFEVHAPRAIAEHLLARHAAEVARKHGFALGNETHAATGASAAAPGGRLEAGARQQQPAPVQLAQSAPIESPPHESEPLRDAHAPDDAPHRDANGESLNEASDDTDDETASDVAIVGMAGIFPQSADLAEFWRHLAAGDDLIAEAPPSRWDWRAADGEPASRWGGFIPRVEYFDAAFFGISPREAEQMDPQQRLLMQTAWAALEDAAIRPSDLMGSDAAVFVGVSTSDYMDLLPGADGHLAVGNAHAMLPNRLSHLLGTHGPSEAVDTACSSSLVALHRAVRALRRGESGVAIVGGVNVMLTTRLHRALAAAGMLSPDGRCKTFDASANGYVRGEGVAALVLMPLERARAGGHPVLAVIKGSAINHGGRAAFLTAPDVNAQAALIEAAYRDARVDPATVSYVEAHGTGTSLGDPIEVQALRQGFDACARERAGAHAPARCGLGSVKTNIGHLEAAAGLAGVVKVVLAMNRRTLPPSLHCREPNPFLKLDDSRYYVVTEPAPWPGAATPTPLRAGVSSFGFGGSNAHVVLQSAGARPIDRASAARSPSSNARRASNAQDPSGSPASFVPLSARTDTALRERAAQLARWLDAERIDDASLPALAKTLSIGRETMARRFGITCSSLAELRAQLAIALDGSAESLTRDDARLRPPAPAHAAWLSGDAAPLPVAWDEETPRLRLPVYPFEGERHWPTDEAPPSRFALAPEGDGAYRMSIAPDAPLVADHRLAGEPVLAAAAQIVIAWRALEANANAIDAIDASGAGESNEPTGSNGSSDSSGSNGSSNSSAPNPSSVSTDSDATGCPHDSRSTIGAAVATHIALHDIEWLAPIAIAEPTDLHVALAHAGADNGGNDYANVNPERGENRNANETGGALQFSIAVSPAVDAPLGRGHASRVANARANAPALDIDAIRARCTQPISADACYDAFAAIGIDYGPTFRPLRALAIGRDEVLAEFDASALARTTGDARLVALIDGAFQAIAGLQLAGAGRIDGALLPASLARIELTGPLADSAHAWIREVSSDAGRRTFDLDLVTVRGEPCAALRGLALASGRRAAAREAPRLATPGDHLLAPQWLPCANGAASTAAPAPRAGALTVLGGTPAQHAALAATHPTKLHTIDDLAELDAHVSHLVWLPPAAEDAGTDAHAPLARCAGLDGFRLVKRLLALGVGDRAFELTVLTVRSWTMPGDAPAFPAHADLAGLCGSLANEYPHWRVRLVDLSDADALPADWRAREAESGPPLLLHRHGQWFARRLVPLAALPARAEPPYRPGGVYVAIGGAGGIGRVWTEHVIRACGAQVVWIGRRPLDAQIDAHCSALAALGPRPSYLSADASDADALRAARDTVLARFGRIDGVVHTAIVLQDGGLAQQHEAQFSAALSAQVATSANLARVFGGDALDFILFFSSLQSAFVAAGQGNYAAGCTFRDAFADWLRTQVRCAVKVVNWGFWGQTGVVASEPYRQRMAALGIGSIEPAAAMAVVDALLGASVDQVGYLKTTASAALPTLAPALAARIAPRTNALADAPPHADATGDSAQWRHALAALDRAIARRLFAALAALRVFGGDDASNAGKFDIDTALRSGRIAPAYGRWLAHALALIAKHGCIAWNGRTGHLAEVPASVDNARAEWTQARADLARTGLVDAHLALVDATLDALPAILEGRVSATSILFPDGDLSRVEAVYQRNEQADRCNRALADAVLHLVGGTSAAPPAALAEIGAGTGGTTAPLLAALDASGARLGRYDFTDISKAFLLNAEQSFGRGREDLRYRLFDVERPIAEQALDAGGYDIVIATNVLHATQDIGVTLRNAKALLKTGGHLIVNELLDTHTFAHATFGLLPGWWRHRDSARRLPGSPLLSRDGWARALREAGFAVLDGDPADRAPAGQGVIVAVSDGVIVQPAIVGAHDAARGDVRAHAGAAASAASAASGASAASAIAAPPPAAASAGADLRARCVQWLTQLVARTLKMPTGKLAPDQPLGGYGVDSILVIGLTKTLRETLGVALSNATLFEHATLNALADFFVAEHRTACERVLGGDAAAPANAASDANASTFARAAAQPHAAIGVSIDAPAPAYASTMPDPAARNASASRTTMPATPTTHAAFPRTLPALPAFADDAAVAVIGMSGRYAQADNLREFWANLRAGRHCITEVPAERWDWRTHFDPEKGAPGRTYSRWGGFLKQIDRFDAAFFRIAPRDAENIDPQGRLFLEESWAAIEDAGYTSATLSANRQVGVFVGVMNGDYPTGAQFWSIANRVSHALDLHGPSLAVDTACSSSLTAIHLALDSLRSGTCDCALAGGVNLIQSPKHLVGLSSLTMLSAGDACRAFGAGADGFVDGEGVGVLVLKPLSRALADGDAIHGVIRGSMINAGGKTHGLTVPNPRAQQAVVAAALARSGVPPRAVGYVEAHGTGTALGDPIELAGLTRAFADTTGDRGFCALGSVKSNIGHCESAAGVAGVTKVLLQMKHRELVPTLHADEANPDIDFAQSPFALQRRLAPWPKPDLDGWPRIAGVSSFGAGGANAHVVLEEFVDARAASADDARGPAIVVLSAATDDALRRRAQQLHALLAEGEIGDDRLHDLAYTLQVGREPMAARFGCVAGCAAALKAMLAAFVEGDAPHGWHAHRLAAGHHGLAELDADPELRASLIGQCISTGKLDRLAALWCQGLGVDWSELHRGHARRRMHLPAYPFDGPSYRLRDEAALAAEPVRRQAIDAARVGTPAMRAAIADAPGAPDASTRAASTPDVATLVRRTVAQALGYPEVDLNESFLSLGGDSIRAARVHRTLQQALGVKIPLSLMLEAKTLADCVRAIGTLTPAGDASAACSSTADSIDIGEPALRAFASEPGASPADESSLQAASPRRSAPAPRDAIPRVHKLSPNQQQFFFLDRLNPANPAFNLPGALRVRGEWHADALEAAYQALIDSHDVLRTRFVVRGGEPCAEVAPHRAATIRRHDLSALLPKHQAARIAECLTESSREGFALEQGEPSRLTVLELRDDDHVILLNLHHIVGDAVSVVALLDALARAALTGRASAPCDAHPQYAEWAAREDEPLAALVERELPYWLERLRDVPPPLPLPCDRARPPVPSYRGQSVPLAFPPELTAQLDAYCKAHGLSRFVVMLAAFKVALRVLSGRDDVVVGSPYANRADDDTADMIGCLAYALVLRTRVGEAETFADAVSLVRRTVHGAFDHLGVPYPRLVEALNPARHGGANPLYQIMFNVIPMPALPDGVEPVEVDSGWLDYDLFVRLRASDRAIEGVLQFSADLFDRSTAEAIATYYVELLHTLLALPSLPLAGLAPPAGLALARTIADAMPPLRIEIASTFTDRPLAGTLRYWGAATGQPIEPNFAPYGQLLQTLYDPSTPFHANRRGMNVVLVRPRDWLRFGEASASAEAADADADADADDNADADASAAAEQIALYVDELADALADAAPSLAVPLLVLVLPDDASSLAACDTLSGGECIGECGGDCGEQRARDSTFAPYRTLAAALADLPAVTVAHWRDVAAIYPVADVFDPHADAAGHVPFTSEYYAALASYIARTAFQHASVPLDDAWNRLAAQIRDDAEHLLAAPAGDARARRAPYAPPTNDAEATLAPIFAAALKLDDLGVDDNFFDCGGHSILAIGVVYQINEAFGTSLSVADIFMAPTVRRLAERMRDAPDGPEYVDLASAAVLPDDVAPLPEPVAGTPRALLLTGATGFVGRHLLRELIDRTGATIYCLVRSPDAAQGLARLRATLERWSLWRDGDEARVIAVPGDLGRPRIGLSSADRARLVAEVDAIYHNGTSMNHLESFEMARAANVDGVIELLRIATEGRPKTFNYVSTLAVFSMRERTGTHVFDESAPIDAEQHPSDQGYTTSKWVGEQLAHLAAARGVPCNVFRLGLVTGDVRHGRYDALQAYYRLLKSCVLMGAAFDDFRYDLVITPVDYVARALAHLGAKHPGGGRVFHLSTMQVTPMRTVFEMMNAHLPAPMRMLTHRAWIDELRVRYRRGDVQPIVPVVQWMMNMSDGELVKLAREREETTFIYDCTATHRELEAAGIVVPVFDDALLQRYLRGMFDDDADLRALAPEPDDGERASSLHSHT